MSAPANFVEKLGLGRFTGGNNGHGASRSHAFPHAPPCTLIVETAPKPSIVLENVVAVPSGTFHDGQYVICDGKYVFSARVWKDLPPNCIGVGGPQREWTQWAYKQEVRVESFDIFANGNSAVYIASIDLEIDFYSRNKANSIVYEQDQLAKEFIRVHRDNIFTTGQMFAMEKGSVNFKVVVRGMQIMDLDGKSRGAGSNKLGILLPQTEVTFQKSANSLMQLKGANRARTNLLQPNFSFENMGIGGLDNEFSTILRRAFATRLAPPRDVERLGIEHVKGMLLYGPPGTGKTLIARQIGKMLNAVEPKVVNGPEILSKYVGGSEENIRKLFKDAEAEYRAKGDDSNLHIIIFDELDAVFRQRGSRSDNTGVGDNVVNQVLSKMDGVHQLNNILVIGMTNRLDLIDSALLRPGRFEIKLEIPLPDRKGRKQIFLIHTTKMRDAKLLGSDVDFDELAELTKNYSGAEIAGVVRAASQFSLRRNLQIGKQGQITYDNKKDPVVVREDFIRALDDVRPAFGTNEEDIQKCLLGGIVHYSPNVDTILAVGEELVTTLRKKARNFLSCLLHGSAQAGKTALAACFALNSQFPFIRMITAKNMIGMNETQKIAHIQNVFNDAYKSPFSVIIVDNIEAVVEWSDVGPRFSNPLVVTLSSCFDTQPPKDRCLLLIGTTSDYHVLERLRLTSFFTETIYVPTVSTVESLMPIFAETSFLIEQDRARVIDAIASRTGSRVLSLGIKKVLDVISISSVSQNPGPVFVEKVVDLINRQKGI